MGSRIGAFPGPGARRVTRRTGSGESMAVDGISGAAGDEDTLMVDPMTEKSENPKSARGAASRRRKTPEVRRLSSTFPST